MTGLLKLALMVVLLLASVCCQQTDADSWRGGIEQNKWLNSEVMQDLLVRMARRPGPRQHLGLMGKKDSARKRHKFQTFVGLMGKRGFEDRGAL